MYFLAYHCLTNIHVDIKGKGVRGEQQATELLLLQEMGQVSRLGQVMKGGHWQWPSGSAYQAGCHSDFNNFLFFMILLQRKKTFPTSHIETFHTA